MIKIFKQLGRHWAACIAVVALLFVQAYCDLSLPDYTSKIVDIGIQQGGIESSVPETVRDTTLQALELLMSEQDAALAEQWYSAPDADGVRTLSHDATAAMSELENAFATPDVVLYMAASQNAATAAGTADAATPTAYDLDAVATQFAAMSQAPGAREMLQSQLAAAFASLDDSVAGSLSSQAMLLVALEYEAQGIAHDVQMRYLLRTGGRMLALTLLMVAVAIAVGFIASRVSAGIGRDLRRDVFRTVVGYSNAEIEKFSTASLITRTTNDIQQVQFVCVILLRMVAYAPILGIGGILHVAGGNTGLTWIIFVAVAALLLLIAVLMNVAMPKFKQMQTLVDRMNLVSREILTGIPVIRAFSREKFEEKRFEKANRDLMQTQLFTNRVMTFMMPTMMLIMNAITVAIVWFGAKGVDLGNLQVGDMIAFITYTMQIVMAFLMLTMVSIMLPRAGVAATRIEEVLDTEPSIHDAEQTKGDEEDFSGVLEFHDVGFAYDGAKEEALSDISFTARPGETTAIIGSTGCGKTTLLNLIPRFYDVTSGSITIDGIDVQEMSQEKLRSLIGYVPQKGVLFSGTIASNLKFAGDQVSDEMMKEAADIAQAVDFIEEKEEKYNSPIAQGGTNVSGGQKQRLSIARAIAKNPKIFLFDDSFSALDYKTDVALRKKLNERVKDATVLIVAQRISTILHADKIIVLEEGRIAGIGTHEELLAGCETYQEIASSQLSEAELKGGVR